MDKEILDRFIDLEARVKAIEEKLTVPMQVSKKKKTSIREFLDTTKPRNQTEMVVLIGFFIETYEGLDSFTVKELLAGFANAKEKNPTNMNSLVNDNIAKGLLMASAQQDGKRKRFELTNSGIKFVKEKTKKSGDSV